MRYIINTEDTQGLIGIQIEKWRKENKLELIEKSEPVIELQAKLERIARALEMLKKTGYNKEVMISYIHDNSNVGKPAIRGVLEGQDAFFKAIGVKV